CTGPDGYYPWWYFDVW
nr:immunoglobulin heavy chain junction region [Mus musculus]